MRFARDLQRAREIAAEILVCLFEFLVGQGWVNCPQAVRVHRTQGMSAMVRKKRAAELPQAATNREPDGSKDQNPPRLPSPLTSTQNSSLRKGQGRTFKR